jgi:arylsulfatase A-like enzyme
LFLPDQHRSDWLGINPDLPLRTPVLDRLAANGLRFANAFTPSPLCSPARACLATGRDYARCGVKNNGQNTPLDLPTHYRHLRDAGYTVSAVGKLDLHKPDLDWGADGSALLRDYGFSRGIDNEGKGDAIVSWRRNGNAPVGPYMTFLHEQGLAETHLAMYQPHLGDPDWLNFTSVTGLPEHAYCDNWIADNARRELREFPSGTPWHLVVNFVGPHGPFDVTPAMSERWSGAEIPPPADHPDPHSETVRTRRRNYAAMIENIDTQIGRILAEVERRGEMDNTVIVYASDHGEMLGDHNRWEKSVWYHPSVGIPLIVAGPGIRPNAVSKALVSLHDLAPTFLELAGAAPLPDSDALSLLPLLRGQTNRHRDFVESALNDWRMVYLRVPARESCARWAAKRFTPRASKKASSTCRSSGP